MPIYAYRCASCGHAKDVLQQAVRSAARRSARPAARRASSKQVTAAGFQLKGSGWYVTDFRKRQARRQPTSPTPTSRRPTSRPQTRREARRGRRRCRCARGSGAGASRDAGRAAGPAAASAASGPRRRRSELRAGRRAVRKYLIAGLLVWLPLAVTVWVLTRRCSACSTACSAGFSAPPRRCCPTAAHALRSKCCATSPAWACRGAAGGAAADRHLRGQHRRPVVAAPGRPAAATRFRSSSRSTARSSRSRTRCSRAAATRFARRCWCSTRARAAWTIAFVTGRPGGEAAQHLHADYLSVYVPTTPNPTSGFFLMVPRADVIALRMSVDEALKYVISMGVVAPRRVALPNAAAARN